MTDNKNDHIIGYTTDIYPEKIVYTGRETDTAIVTVDNNPDSPTAFQIGVDVKNIIPYVDSEKAEYVYLKKVKDYLYETVYTNIDYDYAYDYFKANKIDTISYGACTSIGKDNLLGRNFDWFYSEDAEFIVRTPAETGRYSTIGIGHVNNLTKDMVENKYFKTKEDYDKYVTGFKILPFMLTDGMNTETGLTISTNVVPNDKNAKITDQRKVFPATRTPVCMVMLIRYLIDHCKDIDEVKYYLENKVSVFASQILYNMNYEQHFLLRDVHIDNAGNKVYRTVALEYINDRPVFKDVNYITNFYIDGVNFNEDGKVFTPYTKHENEEDDAYIVNKITPHGSGLERWNILVDKYTTTDLITLLSKDLVYTKAYTQPWKGDANKPKVWYTEFVGEYNETDLKINSDTEDFEIGILPASKNAFDTHERGNGTWQTMHTVVYDLDKKELSIACQQEYNEWFTFYNKYLTKDAVLSLLEDESLEIKHKTIDADYNKILNIRVDTHNDVGAHYNYKNFADGVISYADEAVEDSEGHRSDIRIMTEKAVYTLKNTAAHHLRCEQDPTTYKYKIWIEDYHGKELDSFLIDLPLEEAIFDIKYKGDSEYQALEIYEDITDSEGHQLKKVYELPLATFDSEGNAVHKLTPQIRKVGSHDLFDDITIEELNDDLWNYRTPLENKYINSDTNTVYNIRVENHDKYDSEGHLDAGGYYSFADGVIKYSDSIIFDSEGNHSDISLMTEQAIYKLKNTAGHWLRCEQDSENYIYKIFLEDYHHRILNSFTIDLPIEEMITNITYKGDSEYQALVVYIDNGTSFEIPLATIDSEGQLFNRLVPQVRLIGTHDLKDNITVEELNDDLKYFKTDLKNKELDSDKNIIKNIRVANHKLYDSEGLLDSEGYFSFADGVITYHTEGYSDSEGYRSDDKLMTEKAIYKLKNTAAHHIYCSQDSESYKYTIWIEDYHGNKLDEFIIDSPLENVAWDMSLEEDSETYRMILKLLDKFGTVISSEGFDLVWEQDSESNYGVIQRRSGSRATGDYAIAMGRNSHAKGEASVTEGINTSTNNQAEHAEGRYNYSHTGNTEADKTQHSIGIGHATQDMSGRQNAVEIMANGDVYIIGIGNYEGQDYSDAYTLQTIINSDIQQVSSFDDSIITPSKSNLNKLVYLTDTDGTNIRGLYEVTESEDTYIWKRVTVGNKLQLTTDNKKFILKLLDRNNIELSSVELNSIKNIEYVKGNTTTNAKLVITYPDDTTEDIILTDVVVTDKVQTLTNKSIDADDNTITDIDKDEFKSGFLQEKVTNSNNNMPLSNAVYRELINNTNSDFEYDSDTEDHDKLILQLVNNDGETILDKIIDFEDDIVFEEKEQTIINKTIEAKDNTLDLFIIVDTEEDLPTTGIKGSLYYIKDTQKVRYYKENEWHEFSTSFEGEENNIPMFDSEGNLIDSLIPVTVDETEGNTISVEYIKDAVSHKDVDTGSEVDINNADLLQGNSADNFVKKNNVVHKYIKYEYEDSFIDEIDHMSWEG